MNGKRAKQIRRDARAIVSLNNWPPEVTQRLIKGLKKKAIQKPPPPEEGVRVNKSENPRSGAFDE